MIYLYIFSYLIIGLGVAKFFQRWLNETLGSPEIDIGLFSVLIIIWPLCVFIRLTAWLVQLWTWFFHLWEAKP